MSEPTIEINTAPTSDESKGEPVVVVVSPENDSAVTDELAQLREYKTRRETEDAALAQATADEALRVAELALEIAVDAEEKVIEAEIAEELEELAEENIIEPLEDITPDIAPKIEHPWFRPFGSN